MDCSPEISKLSVNNSGDSQLGVRDVYANVNISKHVLSVVCSVPVGWCKTDSLYFSDVGKVVE